MKANKLLVIAGIASLCVTTLGGVVANAETETKTVVGKSEGKVEFVFEEDDNKPVSPTEPPGPTTPPTTEPPITPQTAGEATLMWYPNLDFGVHKFDDALAENKYDAIVNKDQMWTNYSEEDYKKIVKYDENGVALDKDGNEIKGEKVWYPAFVQVKNTPKAEKWDLQVSLGDFVNEANDMLDGAQIVVGNTQLVTGSGDAASGLTNFTLDAGAVTEDEEDPNATSPQTVEILSYSKLAENASKENSFNSLLFGTLATTTDNAPTLMKVKDGEKDTYKERPATSKDAENNEVIDFQYNKGVTLILPKTASPQADTTYTADLEWTLTCTF